jgi:VanZ family protein
VGVETRRPTFGPPIAAFLVGASIGLIDELLQIAWPRRYFDWADVAINGLSVGLGLLVAIPLWRALQRRQG